MICNVSELLNKVPHIQVIHGVNDRYPYFFFNSIKNLKSIINLKGMRYDPFKVATTIEEFVYPKLGSSVT